MVTRPGSEVQSEHLGDQGPGLPHLLGVGGDPDQSVGVRVELLLEGDHHDVHGALLGLDVGGDLADVGVVQGGVNLVQDKEGGGLVAVGGEKEGQGSDGLLTSGEVRHGLESLAGSNTIVVDTLKITIIKYKCYKRQQDVILVSICLTTNYAQREI